MREAAPEAHVTGTALLLLLRVSRRGHAALPLADPRAALLDKERRGGHLRVVVGDLGAVSTGVLDRRDTERGRLQGQLRQRGSRGWRQRQGREGHVVALRRPVDTRG